MQNCNVCLKKNLWQSTEWVDYDTGARWWMCRNCGNNQIELPPQGLRVPPKILYLDIENAPMRVYVYELYGERNKSISKDAIYSRRFVINWAAAWVDPETYEIKRMVSDMVTPDEAVRGDDRRVTKSIYNLIDQADYIVGHNVKGHDMKILKARWIVHDYGYPAKARAVDTLTLARETKPESRSLEDLSVTTGGKPKMGLERHEWHEIVERGTPRLIAKSNRYCCGDVREGVRLLRRYALAKAAEGGVVFR